MKRMKTWILSIIGIILINLISCNKDYGNYNYNELDKINVTGLDSLYIYYLGDTLKISPTYEFGSSSKNKQSYKYEWFEYESVGFYPRNHPTLLDSGEVLNTKLNLHPRLYNAVLRVTDTTTNVFQEFPFQLFVTTPVHEGWLILNELENNSSRLDMLSYSVPLKKFSYISDALGAMKSNLKLSGKPSFVGYDQGNIGIGLSTSNTFEQILLITSEIATHIGPDTLEYLKPRYNLDNFINSRQNVRSSNAKFFTNKGFLTFVFYSNNNVFGSFPGIGVDGYFNINVMSATPLNKYFKTSDKISIENTYTNPTVILLNEDENRLVWYPGGGRYSYYLEDKGLFSYKLENKNLLYLSHTLHDGGYHVAITKDKITGKIHLAKFTPSKQIAYEEITGTEIHLSEHIAIDRQFGYIFYNVNGKVFQYDPILKLNTLMEDYGAKSVSFLGFHTTGRVLTFERNQRYRELSNQLIIATYDKNSINNSGVLDFYEVPSANGKITRKDTYSGFGKIVSLAYRNR